MMATIWRRIAAGQRPHADDWDESLIPEIERKQSVSKRAAVRADGPREAGDPRGGGRARRPVRDPYAGQ